MTDDADLASTTASRRPIFDDGAYRAKVSRNLLLVDQPHADKHREPLPLYSIPVCSVSDAAHPQEAHHDAQEYQIEY
jgi:hypothetical protein